MVRLLQDQKLQLLFNDVSFESTKIDVSGNFIMVEDVAAEEGGWVATISQNRPIAVDNTLYLGNINIYDGANQRQGSLCVVSKNGNDDVLTVVNPKNNVCNMELNQVLDVVFQTDNHLDSYFAFPVGNDLCTEEIQHFSKVSSPEGKICVEHMFRFRFNLTSVERLSEKPVGKYDGGQIVFLNSRNEKFTIRLVCSWRCRSSIYKALLLPRIPSSNAMSAFKKQKKQCMKTDITLVEIESTEIDSGCNVLLSKNF